MADVDRQSFFFLFRSDEGRVDRATWLRHTVPLAVLAGAGTLGWVWLSPYAHHDLATTQFLAPLTIVAYVYLLLFAFAVMLLAICEYNLSAKRFRDRGKPAALAAILPASALAGSATIWFIPLSFGAIPAWVAPVVVAGLALVVLWNVVELGVLQDRSRP